MPNYLTFTRPELCCAVPVPARGVLGAIWLFFISERMHFMEQGLLHRPTTIAAGVMDRIVLAHALHNKSREWTITGNVVPGPRGLFLPPSATWGATNWFRH